MELALFASSLLFAAITGAAIGLAIVHTVIVGRRILQRRKLRVPGSINGWWGADGKSKLGDGNHLYETTYTPPDVRGKTLAFYGDVLTETEVQGVSIALAEFFYSVKRMVRG